MNFKSSKPLVDRVKNKLKSYQAAGLLEEGDFYRWIKEILTLLNVPSYSPVHSIVELDGNKMKIPDDMYQLWNIYRYEVESCSSDVIRHYQRQERYLVRTDQIQSVCEEDCNTITHESDIMISKYYIEQHQPPVITRYNRREPIKVVNYIVNGQKNTKCAPDAPCLFSNRARLTAGMDGGHFYFNFENGSVYLQYYRLMLDDDGLPMIPEVTEIELAIENYIVFRFLEELYINSTIDALQRMQYAQAEFQKAFDKAKTWVKTPSARSLYEINRKNKYRFQIFELKHSRSK